MPIKCILARGDKRTLCYSVNCDEHNSMETLTCCAVRLHPGDDLMLELVKTAKKMQLPAACVVTCVGSLKRVKLRLAGATALDKNQILTLDKPMEIVSLVGTFSSLGGAHLHISLADENGKMFGGHLLAEGGAIIHTTAEIVIGSCGGVEFRREFDQETGFNELCVTQK